MSEWFKDSVLKTDVASATVGSNPTSSYGGIAKWYSVGLQILDSPVRIRVPPSYAPRKKQARYYSRARRLYVSGAFDTDTWDAKRSSWKRFRRRTLFSCQTALRDKSTRSVERGRLIKPTYRPIELVRKDQTSYASSVLTLRVEQQYANAQFCAFKSKNSNNFCLRLI